MSTKNIQNSRKFFTPIVVRFFTASSFAVFLTACHYLQSGTGQALNNSGGNSDNKSTQKLEATYSSIKANIIDKRCIGCHKAGGKAEDIPFETEDQLVNGKIDDGPLVVPGKPADSAFYKVMNAETSIRGDLDLMPPAKVKNPVTSEELQIVAAWITGSAKNDETNKQPPAPDTPTNPSPQPAPAPQPAPNPTPQPAPTPQPVPPPVDEAKFEQVFKEVIKPKCLTCHNTQGKVKDLPLETLSQVLSDESESGVFIVPGNAQESILYKSLLADDQKRAGVRKMPPAKAVKAGQVPDVTEDDIKLVEKWINSGAN